MTGPRANQQLVALISSMHSEVAVDGQMCLRFCVGKWHVAGLETVVWHAYMNRWVLLWTGLQGMGQHRLPTGRHYQQHVCACGAAQGCE